MTGWKQFIQSITDRQIFIVAIVLAFPAFLYNLGLTAFIGDEGIRTLVALEMKWSKNYLVPTLNGVYYFNKPPLFNWFILLASELWGSFGEWPTRLTNLFFLSCYTATVFYYSRKHFNWLVTATLSLMLLTSGRILLWDSMFGLIDICFSWIIFLNFMILYHLSEREKWNLLFIISYLLCAIAFMLKGLPAVVFQAISILVTLQFHGVLRRKLFTRDHFTGIAIGLIPVVIYYVLYAYKVSLIAVFHTLFDQSIQRTAVEHGFWRMILHVLTFPLEQVYHFLPWSLLIIVFFHGKFRNWVRENKFVQFNLWMFLANIPVYWLSVEIYPRYLLMFVPLFNVFGYYALEKTREINERWWRIIHIVFTAIVITTFVACLSMPLFPEVRKVSAYFIFWIGGSLALLFLSSAVFLDKNRMFIWMCVSLLVFRIIFNSVILPIRSEGDKSNTCRKDCMRLAKEHGDRRWYIYCDTPTGEVARFYTSKYCNKLIKFSDFTEDSNAYYLVDFILYPDFKEKLIDSLYCENGKVIGLMQIDK